MSTYLLIDGRQQGPYSPAQLQALLSSSAIQQDCLAWRVGLSEWRPLRSLLVSWQERSETRRPAGSAGSAVGIVALIIGGLGILAWPILLVVGALLESEPMLALLGLLVLGGMGLNLLGAALGGIGLFGNKTSKIVPIIGLCLNLLQFLGMASLLVLGVAMDATTAS